MEIVEGDISQLQTVETADDEMTGDSKLYIAEHMLIENDMFGNSKGTVIVGEKVEDESEETEAVEHIIIDGQVCLIDCCKKRHCYYIFSFLANTNNRRGW